LLIDAGTGLGDLPLNHMTGIRHIFLTHCMMNPLSCMPRKKRSRP
jgi:3',5'-cyclic-nucleotide phosphodiesterase